MQRAAVEYDLTQSIRSAGSDRVQGLQLTPCSLSGCSPFTLHPIITTPWSRTSPYGGIAHRPVTVTQRCSVTNRHFCCDLHRVACHCKGPHRHNLNIPQVRFAWFIDWVRRQFKQITLTERKVTLQQFNSVIATQLFHRMILQKAVFVIH